jgi:hypothetical protein
VLRKIMQRKKIIAIQRRKIIANRENLSNGQ